MLKNILSIKNQKSVYLIFVGLVFILMWRFFNGMNLSQFLFIHDEYLIFNGPERFDQFYLRNFMDLGTSQTFSLFVTIFDRLFYYISYSSNASIQNAQYSMYFFKLILILILPYKGFRELSSFYRLDISEQKILLISLWYSFNTYTVIYWHGNAFSLTLLICYSLAPIGLLFFDKTLDFNKIEKSNYKEFLFNAIVLVLIFFLMSFALYLFAPFVVFLTIHLVFRWVMNIKKSTILLKKIFLFSALSAPIFIMHFMILYEMFALSSGVKNETGGETFGNIQGGILYMLLMWFTWPMYLIWTPRNIWTFTEHYRSAIAIMAPFFLYFQIIWGMLKKKKTMISFSFLICFLVLVFLAKGPQEPLGDIFIWLIKHVPGFRVFRSPDSKFGFAVILSVACLLICFASEIRLRYFAVLMCVVIYAQSWPLLSGLAIQGENTATSRDRVIFIPNEYKELANFFNDSNRSFGYVLTVPSIHFGPFQLSNDEQHFGQDLIPKMIKYPFVYANESTGMAGTTYEKLIHNIKNGQLNKLQDFAIRYYIQRHDTRLDGQHNIKNIGNFLLFLNGNLPIVFQNTYFTVFEDPKAKNILQVANADYEIINQTKIGISLNKASDSNSVQFLQSYHPSWKLYPETKDFKSSSFLEDLKQQSLFHSWIEAVQLVFRKDFVAKKLNQEFGNFWSLDQHAKVKNFQLVYWPQYLFILLSSISLFFVCVYLGLIFLLKPKT